MAFRLSARERIDLLNAHLFNVAGEPAVYGNKIFGGRLYGTLRDNVVGPYYFRGAWFSFLGAPLWPTGVYLVDDPDGPPCRFFGQLKLGDFHRIFAGGLRGFYSSALGESARGFMVLGTALLAAGWFFS